MIELRKKQNNNILPLTICFKINRRKILPWITGSHWIIRSRSSAFQTVTSINDTFSCNRKVSKSVVFLFYSCVRHWCHSGSLLRKTEIIRSPRGSAWGLYRLRPTVMRTSIPARHTEIIGNGPLDPTRN